MVSLLTEELSTAEKYKYLIASIMPRPIALVTTTNSDGSINLAPFSSLNLVASNPVTLSFSISAKPDGSKKDTLINVEQNQEFVVNSAHSAMLKQVALAGAAFPYGQSELEKCGLATCASTTVKPPGLLDSLFRMECKVEQLVPIGKSGPGSATIVVGQIKIFHIADSIIQNGRVDFKKVDMLARLGGYWYANLGERFEEPIPDLDKL